MEPVLIIKIALVGIIVTIINSVLKQSGREELTYLTTLTGLIVVVLWLLPYISDFFLTIQQLLRIV